MILIDFVSKVLHRVRSLGRPAGVLEGYESPDLINLVFEKTTAFLPTDSWPDIVGAATVLDFGGGCGLHYKQAIIEAPQVRWAVVETPAMVAKAATLATDRLKFFTDVHEAARWLGPIDVMHSSGALQYVPDPLATLSGLCLLRAKTMLWSRMFLSDEDFYAETQSSKLVDNGPGRAPAGTPNMIVKHERRAIPEDVFLKAHRSYSLEPGGGGSYKFALVD